jgi:hypothetical protein
LSILIVTELEPGTPLMSTAEQDWLLPDALVSAKSVVETQPLVAVPSTVQTMRTDERYQLLSPGVPERLYEIVGAAAAVETTTPETTKSASRSETRVQMRRSGVGLLRIAPRSVSFPGFKA